MIEQGILIGTEQLDAASLLAFARDVEAMGYESLWLPELFGREPVLGKEVEAPARCGRTVMIGPSEVQLVIVNPTRIELEPAARRAPPEEQNLATRVDALQCLGPSLQGACGVNSEVEAGPLI